ncbi:hypothetical protein Hte_009200 [Hypoxylon texense]
MGTVDTAGAVRSVRSQQARLAGESGSKRAEALRIGNQAAAQTMLSLAQIIVGLSCTIGYVLGFDGDITYYTPGLGSCGQTDTEADKVVALSPSQFSTLPDLCGKDIVITLNGKNTTAKVVDKCPACSPNSIDVSPSVFQDLASLDAGRLQVSWSLA